MDALKAQLAGGGRGRRASLTAGGVDAAAAAAGAGEPATLLTYDIKELEAPGPYPMGCRLEQRELHLSDEQFKKLIGCDKDTFAAWPKWKQHKKKRELKLF